MIFWERISIYAIMSEHRDTEHLFKLGKLKKKLTEEPLDMMMFGVEERTDFILRRTHIRRGRFHEPLPNFVLGGFGI